jgi:hypothetical protein
MNVITCRCTEHRRFAASIAIALVFSLLLAAVPAGATTDSLDRVRDRGVEGIPTIALDQAPGTVAQRLATAAQAQALAAFTAAHPAAVARWDRFAGSIDVLHGFASAPSSAPPEQAALDFLAANQAIFGSIAASALQHRETVPALGGYLVRFDQVHAGVPVENAGFGFVLDGSKRVRAVSGPFYTDVTLDAVPALTAADAVAAAAADLAPFARTLDASSQALLEPALAHIEAQLGILAQPHPELRVVPTATDHELAWSFLYFSRNPFGLYRYLIDARSGAVLGRESLVRTQQAPPITADYFPTSPPITPQLQDEGALVDADGEEVGRPLGQIRVEVRKMDPSSRVTGARGTLTGTHAAIFNALPIALPFAGAAAGAFHFSQDAPPLEGRTDERDQTAEPAEHQDGISQFLYITSLMEYLDYLHKAGDAVHSQGVGQGDFPDSYPNESTPLTGTVHIPNLLEDICGPLSEPGAPDFQERLLACDNAFAIPASTTVAGEEVIVNPTFYGHGFLFNDLGIDFAVPLHEGTHSTITPIAGLEGSPEGGALNEGQADLFAYTIGENTSLGGYIVNAFKLRQAVRDGGGDPDAVRWIRNADSQLRYSQLGTRNDAFEVHRDGEIYAGAMWDVRQLLLQYQTGGPYKRPNPVTGLPTDPIALGKETWERLFLGSMYVLGTMSPDTFVRARDAMLVADAVLYPADPVDPATPGRHRAVIEQAFAARELGANAMAPVGGRQTISTAVSAYVAALPKPAAPQGVVATPVSATAVEVSWQPVSGAVAYEVLKRKAGGAQKRLFPGVLGREYHDGDVAAQLSGYTFVEHTYGNGATTYVDRGQWVGSGAGNGLASLDYEYVVRAIAPLGAAHANQLGFSDLSGRAPVAVAPTDVTAAVQRILSNHQFSNGVFSFDQTLRNQGGAGAFDGTIYTPITMKVISISDPTVSVANADNGGSGQNGDEAHFAYQPSLAVGQSSQPRTLRFNAPAGQLFTFDAVVTGGVEYVPRPATGSQPADGALDPAPQPEPNPRFVEEFTGLVVIGSGGIGVVDGVDYVDVELTTKPSAVSVTATLSATPSASPYPDLDFQLRTLGGQVIASSGNLGPDEEVAAAVTGNTTYVYRVVGFANGPTLFRIRSDQEVTDPGDAGGSGATEPSTMLNLARFTVNPLTRTVTVQLLH